MWTLYVDVLDSNEKKYVVQKYELDSRVACEAKYKEVKSKLPIWQRVIQAYAIGPNEEKVVYKKFPDDIYSVWEDLI